MRISAKRGSPHSTGSIIVNPWNIDELADSIHEAVSMPHDARRANHQNLHRYVTKYTAAYWGTNFVKQMAAR